MSRPSIPKRRLNLAQQLASLHRLYPDGKGSIRHPILTWEDQLRPTALNRSYSTAVMYQLGLVPRTYVLNPSLRELANGRRIPHLYSQVEQRLCLYLPNAGEWNPSKFISETIVPWTLLWLFYFEEWLATNEWKGGGVHPPRKD